METRAVREILPLPEILPLEDTPDDIVGVANLRGEIVPIMDLNRRFGHPSQSCRLDDCVVVLERSGSAVGMIVNEVQTVRDIAPEERAPLPAYGAEARPDSRFLTGLVKSGEQVVMLLHLENLLCLSQSLKEAPGAEGTLPDAFRSDPTPMEKAVLRERARELARTPEGENQARLPPLAVVRLDEEFFGIPLQAVREFAELRNVTPVPCCPEHVVGQMNLRGDLITLVDVAGFLGLRPSHGREGRKVVVVNDAELRAGVLVDELLDVLSPRAADGTTALSTTRLPGSEYLRGTAPYGSRMLSLLDLPALLRQDALLVNEKP